LCRCVCACACEYLSWCSNEGLTNQLHYKGLLLAGILIVLIDSSAIPRVLPLAASGPRRSGL
jgi:hypothetical protein